MDAKLTRMLLIIMTFGARVQSISTSRSVLHVTWTRNRENIEAHAHNVALRDMPRTAFPIPVFAVPGLKNHQHSSMIRIVLRLSLSLHVRSAQEWS